MTASLAPDVASLLAAHGLDSAAEAPLAHNGYSGARISRIEHDAASYILKRVRIADDWIMRHTRDETCREAQFAVALAPMLPPGVDTPVLGAARDGDGFALLMRDISTALLPTSGIIEPATMDGILLRIAGMHATDWPRHDARQHVGFCDHALRLTLLSPEVGRSRTEAGDDFGLERGWQVFGRLAPPAAVDIAMRLLDDPAPLVRMLAGLPQTLLHGDLKVANMGWDGERLWLFDWAVVTYGAVALDLAWLLAVNSNRLPWSLDETLQRYHAHRRTLPRHREQDWPRQRAAIALAGLVLYGWGKALDAEAGAPAELDWWCLGAMEAERLLA